MEGSLSICIIARDEEKNIKRCLDSVLNIADEIILVDTGSKDNTAKIAEELGAKVYFNKWKNDFSEAKNFALDKCTKEWIFVIDADEALEEGHDKFFKEILKNTKAEALHMRLNNIIGTEIINENPTLRIFRNRKGYRYRSKLHEQIYSSIEEISGEDKFINTDLILNHYGYDHNVIDMNKKIKRNIDILNSYTIEEKDPLYYFALGNEYMKISQVENAKEAFEKAAEMGDKKQGIRTYLAITLAQVYYKLGKNSTGLKHINKFLKEFPDFRDLYFMKAVCNNELMRYSESFVALNLFKSMPVIKDKYPSFNFDKTNNIDELLQIIQNMRIAHEKNMLTTIIVVNKVDSRYKDMIRSINEISDDILLFNLSGYKEVEEESFELGANAYNYLGATKNDIKEKVLKEAKGKWILFLNEDRVVDHNEALEICNKLKQDKNDIKGFEIIRA